MGSLYVDNVHFTNGDIIPSVAGDKKMILNASNSTKKIGRIGDNTAYNLVLNTAEIKNGFSYGTSPNNGLIIEESGLYFLNVNIPLEIVDNGDYFSIARLEYSLNDNNNNYVLAEIPGYTSTDKLTLSGSALINIENDNTPLIIKLRVLVAGNGGHDYNLLYEEISSPPHTHFSTISVYKIT